MFHRSCAFCSQPAAAAVNLGPLLGPIRDSKSASGEELFAHRLCAVWSPEVSQAAVMHEAGHPGGLAPEAVPPPQLFV